MKIARIFGIDIYVNVSWLFVFALVAWSLAGNVGPLHAVSIGALPRAILAVITAFLFFASVLVHELAHSLVARARGIPIYGIRLFIFGGISLLEREADSAPSEAWISLIGPLTSIAVYFFFALAANLIDHGRPPAIPARSIQDAATVACSYLAFANVLLAFFNILPAYPLDGGRFLHAIIWRITGNKARATTIAVITGRLLAGAIVSLGIAISLLGGLGGGLWITFIGWFIFQAGEAERVAARVGDALRGHRAAELATPSPTRVAADSNATDALNVLLSAQINAAPVFIGDRFLGIVTLQDLVRVSDPGHTYVTAVMTQAEDVRSIGASADAAEVTRRLSRGSSTMLPVIDDRGDLVGFITRESILDWMSTHT